MKKIIFLLLIVSSSLFGSYILKVNNTNIYCSGVVYSNQLPFNVYDINNGNKYYTTAYLGIYNNSKWYSNGGTNQAYSDCSFSNYCLNGQIWDDSSFSCKCPAGQEIINGACAVPPTCPNGQIWNSDTDTCECSPRPVGFTIDVPLSEQNCNITQANLLLAEGGNGQTLYISAVQWDSCRNVCLGDTEPCPCGQALFNGQCTTVEPPEGSCAPELTTFSTMSLGLNNNVECTRDWFCNGYSTPFHSASVGCCLGNTGTNDGDGDGQPDSNSTNPDSNSTNPGDPGDNGGEDGSSTAGDSNTTTPGDSNTSTPGDSNTSGGTGEYEDSDADKDGKGKIGTALDGAYDTLSKIKSDYERLQSRLQNGVTPIALSFGSAPQFCATVFDRQICINLCDSFGYFYSIFYYIFLILFTVMALRIYYTAFKMR